MKRRRQKAVRQCQPIRTPDGIIFVTYASPRVFQMDEQGDLCPYDLNNAPGFRRRRPHEA